MGSVPFHVLHCLLKEINKSEYLLSNLYLVISVLSNSFSSRFSGYYNPF